MWQTSVHPSWTGFCEKQVIHTLLKDSPRGLYRCSNINVTIVRSGSPFVLFSLNISVVVIKYSQVILSDEVLFGDYWLASSLGS